MNSVKLYLIMEGVKNVSTRVHCTGSRDLRGRPVFRPVRP